MKTISLLTALLLSFLFVNVKAQQYVSPTQPPQTGRSPGVKVKLISSKNTTKTYCLVFAEGDEILSGLKEFAVKYKVTSAHFVGIGDASSSKFGWFDKSRKMFKVNELHTFAEITSIAGDITLSKGNPVVHAHINLATEDGLVHGGHLLEAIVNPTLQIMVTIQPIPLYKRMDEASGIMIIDPDLKK
jgi:hypothetical protein